MTAGPLGPKIPCGAPGCARRQPAHYFCCAQHRALLGFELSVRLQTAWRERRFNRDNFETTRAEALRAWGWKETTCPTPTCPT